MRWVLSGGVRGPAFPECGSHAPSCHGSWQRPSKFSNPCALVCVQRQLVCVCVCVCVCVRAHVRTRLFARGAHVRVVWVQRGRKTAPVHSISIVMWENITRPTANFPPPLFWGACQYTCFPARSRGLARCASPYSNNNNIKFGN
jgi:hypothetical protein